MSELKLDNESLMAIPIHDDELSELLRRLASTDLMFQTPVTTVRDVVELTEVPPHVIARILSGIRGSNDIDRIEYLLTDHERRIRQFEANPSYSTSQVIHDDGYYLQRYRELMSVRNHTSLIDREMEERSQVIMWLIGAIVAIVAVIVFVLQLVGSRPVH